MRQNIVLFLEKQNDSQTSNKISVKESLKT